MVAPVWLRCAVWLEGGRGSAECAERWVWVCRSSLVTRASAISACGFGGSRAKAEREEGCPVVRDGKVLGPRGDAAQDEHPYDGECAWVEDEG